MRILKTPHRNLVLSYRDYFAGKGIQVRIFEEDGAYVLESLRDEEDFLVLKEMNSLKNQENPETVLVQAAWDSGSNDRGIALPDNGGCAIPLKSIFTVTGLTITVCIVIFLLQSFMDSGLSRPVFDALSLNAEKFRQGEYWRIITPAFMHFGLMHIAFNTVIFGVLGWQIEKFLSSSRLLVLLVIAAIVGNVSEYCILAGEHEMAPENFGGLSGAVDGVIGYLAVISRYPALPVRMRMMPGLFIITLIMIVVAGLFMNGIANAAHVGGLIAGLAMGGLDLFLLRTGSLTFRNDP
ncbi:rhomboid family intramembrane serine protease [Succinimonas amylolytica]|uniref:rhomboid family intramembrane serine protease n=1 Tax=Succinimonas amylolytica TaxID=83769 RepID=UPI0023A88549